MYAYKDGDIMACGKVSVNSKLPTPLGGHKRWALYRLVDGKPQFFVPAKQGDFFFDVEHEPLSFTENEKRLMKYASAVRKLKAASADGIAYLVGGSLESDESGSRLTAVITHTEPDTKDVAELIERAIHEEPFAVRNVFDDGHTFFIHAQPFGSGGYYFSALEITDGRLDAQAEKERFIAFSGAFRNSYSPPHLNEHTAPTQLIFEHYDPSVLTNILKSLATDGTLDAFNYSNFIDHQTGDTVKGLECRFGEALNITGEVDALAEEKQSVPPNTFRLPEGYDKVEPWTDEEPLASVDMSEEPTPIGTVSKSEEEPADKYIANIPTWLKKASFILWRAIPKGKDKVDKLPMTVIEGELKSASVTNPDHFLDFDDACEYFNQFHTQLAGIGVIFNKDITSASACLTGVDLDDCFDAEGNLDQSAAALVARLDGTYIEITQSGRGLHIIFFDEYAGELKRKRKGKFEMYNSGRFFALTANLLPNHASERFQFPGETLALQREYLLDADELEFALDAPRGVAPTLATDKLLTLIRKSKGADAFNRLMDGDISVRDGDWSKADFALCYKLAWWTNGNFDQIKEIWGSSKLAGRNKFDRPDYPERTVNSAIYVWQKNGAPHFTVPKSKSASKASGYMAPCNISTVEGELDSADVETIRNQLTVNRVGKPHARAHNFDVIFEHDPNVKDIIAFNAFSRRIEIKRRPSWHNEFSFTKAWQDSDDAALQNYIDRTYALMGESVYRRCIDEYAHRNAFHPVRDYFKALPQWDGKERAATLLIDNLGAPDTEYVRAVTKLWLLAAVARVFHPGCRFDRCLVLKGKQGIGKSTLLSKLGGAWFGELDSIQGKDTVEHLQGLWIVELVEMQATKKADNEQIKAFLSTLCDRARLSYERRTADFPRQCVFAATTNEHEFLKDQTGGRRFWIVELEASEYALKPDLEIEQVWAEVFHLYKELFADGFDSAKLDLSPELKTTAVKLQNENTEGSDLQGRIEAFLERPIPIEGLWGLLTAEERRAYFKRGMVELPLVRIEHEEPELDILDDLRRVSNKNIDGNEIIRLSSDTANEELRNLIFDVDSRRQAISPAEIANELCYDDKPPVNTRRIADIMRRLEGWQYKRGKRQPSSVKAYGRQMTVFVRSEESAE